jgi:hypothetical protein
VVVVVGLQADLPDLVSKVGRLCDCKAGPAGAVSGYLAFGTSMDYLYVHKRVPYPLTVEVYGGGNVGKLAAGESNKDLTAWPIVSKSGAPVAASAQFQRRRLQQRQQQEEGSLQGHLLLGRRLLGWARDVLQTAVGAEGVQQGPDAAGIVSNQQQQQRPRKGVRRRRRRRRFSQRLGLLPNATAAAAAAVPAAGDAAGAAAGVGAGGFSAGGNLAQLRQQAKQQLLQDQQSSSGAAGVLSIPNDAQAAVGAQPKGGSEGGAVEGDAILSMVAAAQLHQRGCFDAFNPTDEAEYRRVIADWLAASVIMMKHMMQGEEGQKMIAQVAAGGGVHSSTSSKGQQHSGISIHEPAAASSNSSSTGGH